MFHALGSYILYFAIRNQKSQGFPHSLDLVPADLEIISISGEDFEGDRFVVLGLLELFHDLFKIDDSSTDREMTILLSKIVIRVDMADSATVALDKF